MTAILALLTGLPQFWSIGVSLVHHIEMLFGHKTGVSKASAFAGTLGDLVNAAAAAKSLPLPAGTQDVLSSIGTVTTSVMNAVHGQDWPTSLASINTEEIGGIVQDILPLVTKLAGTNDATRVAEVTNAIMPVVGTFLKKA